jgi:hypothetical protein
MSFHGPPLLLNLHTRKITISPQHLTSFTIFQKKIATGTSGTTSKTEQMLSRLKLIKRTWPAQTPIRPNIGVAIRRNADETAPAKN